MSRGRRPSRCLDPCLERFIALRVGRSSEREGLGIDCSHVLHLLARRVAGQVGPERGQLLIERLEDGAIVGHDGWHTVGYGPNEASRALNIGISLLLDARGHGYGTEAQRLVAEVLLDLYDVERIEASTDIDNVAKQRSLEKAGFTREGILRRAQYRAGGRHDLVSYSILREDL